MPLLLLTFLLVYTFGAVVFGGLFVLCWRQCRKNRQPADRWNLAIDLASTLWFVVNLIVTFKEMYQRPEEMWQWYAALMAIACIFPPLMMGIFCREEEQYLPPSRLWNIAIGFAAATSTVLIGVAFAFGLGLTHIHPLSLMRLYSMGLFSLFFITGCFALVLKKKSTREPRTKRERQEHKWSLTLLAVSVGLFLLLLVSLYGSFPFGQFIGLAARALPLGFISVGTYFRSRFEFFDAFVKQGVYFLLALVALTAFFAGVVPAFETAELGWARPWVFAVFMLPIVFASPWVYRRLGEWLDRAWLGRRFTTVEAVKYFLSEVKGATTEKNLAERAQNCLQTIMQAPTAVTLGRERPDPAFEVEFQLSIPSQGDPIGHIQMGKRLSDEPFFNQDTALVSSLADVLYSLLATVRLQIKKQEQEKREQELIINAGRSELKALRAQINPHFLFNALNAIAGLIERDPERAEETVERLAEVFRYTLRRSESEWVFLGDELEFIQAYLEIEQARFGDRLHVSLEAPECVRELRIPAMMIQTLVENAVKHGVASVRGPGIVTVNAVRQDQILQINVLDNGPGFQLDDPPAGQADGRQGGYGLKNVRQRLQGYFGDAGRLQVSRDERTGQTRVSISIPVLQLASEQVLYDSNPSRR
jgi:hypothetical protein